MRTTTGSLCNGYADAVRRHAHVLVSCEHAQRASDSV